MEIFQPTSAPRKQARAKINEHAVWYTWSNEFRSLFKSLNREFRTLKRPSSTHLLGGKEYDDTYTLSIHSLTDKTLARKLFSFSKCLYNLDVSGRLLLFTDMLDDDLDGRSLGYLFAFFRAALISLSNDPLSALYQPIKGHKRGKEFPLHSDLYIPVILFNVFQEVCNDSTGASLFLQVSSVVELLGQLKTLPPNTRDQIIENLTKIHRQDRYEENFYLLHGWEDWTNELERLMRQRQLRIKLYPGQGYMLHDRRWLHGREAINGKLTHKRLHRLVFNNKAAQNEYRKHVKSS
jgi:hypothetical protein